MNGTVLVTGASSGIGEACARRFAAAGERVVICARRTERLEALIDSLDDAAKVHAVELDVRDRGAVFAMVEALPGQFRDIALLVNNAGLALGLGGADEADLEDWERMVDTNIKGLLYCTRAILPGMVARGAGMVINIGSVAGNWPYPGGNAYGGTKAFVQQFSRNLRADLLGKNIRVTNIEPGMCDTEFSLVRFHGDEERAREVYAGTQPLTGEDVADLVLWLARLPPHVNVNQLEVMPVCQAWGPFAVDRENLYNPG